MTGPRRAPRVPFALLVTGLLVGGLLLLLALNTASAANELERHNLAVQDQSVAAQVQSVRNEVARSAAPGNLARAAAELGMVPAGNPAFIVLGPDGTAKVLGKPKAVVDVPLAIAPAPTTKPKPKPSPTATASPTAKASPTATSTAKSTKATKAGATTTTKAKATTKATKPTTKATPSPTPTPTLTLPGGHR